MVLVKGYKGVNVVKEGANVTEGTLLISGVCVNGDGSEYFVHAQGEVFARTQNTISYSCELQNSLSLLMVPQSRYYLYAFSLKIPLGLKTKGEHLTQSEQLLHSGSTALPFGIVRDDNAQVEKSNVSLTKKEASLNGLLECVKIKRADYNNTEIERVEYLRRVSSSGVEIQAKIDCVENIVKESPILTEN